MKVFSLDYVKVEYLMELDKLLSSV